jgi:hypothetical protein
MFVHVKWKTLTSVEVLRPACQWMHPIWHHRTHHQLFQEDTHRVFYGLQGDILDECIKTR